LSEQIQDKHCLKRDAKVTATKLGWKIFENILAEATKRSQYCNAVKLGDYCKWAKTTPEQLLEEYVKARKSVNTLKDWERDTRTKIIEYYNWLKAKGYKINTERTKPLGILAFYSENCETIQDVTKEFDSVQIPTDEYVFTQEVLRKIYYYADLEGQTLLSLAVALGYSSIDFLNLEAEKLKSLVKEAEDKCLEFMQFIGKSRAKTDEYGVTMSKIYNNLHFLEKRKILYAS